MGGATRHGKERNRRENSGVVALVFFFIIIIDLLNFFMIKKSTRIRNNAMAEEDGADIKGVCSLCEEDVLAGHKRRRSLGGYVHSECEKQAAAKKGKEKESEKKKPVRAIAEGSYAVYVNPSRANCILKPPVPVHVQLA